MLRKKELYHTAFKITEKGITTEAGKKAKDNTRRYE